MSAASAATRAADRRRSCQRMRSAMPVIATATTIEMSVRLASVAFISNQPCPDVVQAAGQLPSLSSQLEFHRDLHDDIDGHALTSGRRETPLSDGLHGAVVEPARQPLKQLHVGHRTV